MITLCVYKDGIYQVKKDSRGYVLVNMIGTYENHGHIKRFKTCKKVISLMKREVVPDSKYLRGTALRVSTNKKYIDKILQKNKKDREKQVYYNRSI